MLDAPHLGPGVHRIAPDEYHRDQLCPTPSLSSTLARLVLNRSPRHAWVASPRLNPDWLPTDSANFDIGRAAHRAVLGAGADFVAIPYDLLSDDGGVRSKAAKDWVADARAEGLTPLKPEVVDQIGDMADAVRTHLAACGIKLDPARSELTALAQIEGVACRAMVDNAALDPRLPIYDFKTTTDASPEGVVKAVAAYGYDVQAAFYLDTWRAATGEDRRFRFVFVEKEPPFEVAVVELYRKPGDEADWFDHANALARDARRIWGECLTSGQWPGYPARVAVIGAPGWHTAKMEARAMLKAPSDKPTNETLARASAWQAPTGETA
jgi:hypothetical protein